MMTDKGIDTGDILLQRETDIGPEETAGQLLERLSGLGAQLLVETIGKLQAGTCPREKQDEARSSYFPMLKKEMGLIDFSQDARRVANLVRGSTRGQAPIRACRKARSRSAWRGRRPGGAARGPVKSLSPTPKRALRSPAGRAPSRSLRCRRRARSP